MEKFTPLAKILNCRRQWRQGKISSLTWTTYVWKKAFTIQSVLFKRTITIGGQGTKDGVWAGDSGNRGFPRGTEVKSSVNVFQRLYHSGYTVSPCLYCNTLVILYHTSQDEFIWDWSCGCRASKAISFLKQSLSQEIPKKTTIYKIKQSQVLKG